LGRPLHTIRDVMTIHAEPAELAEKIPGRGDCYSYRSACVGAILAARRAGT
jgi:hypothetical protein